MIAVLAIAAAGAAALTVVAYGHLRSRSPEASAASLRAVRELAFVVLVCVKAVEGVVDVLAGHQGTAASPVSSSWGYRGAYDYDGYEEDDR